MQRARSTATRLESRSRKFWMVSHPHAIDDGGVEPLMAHWGGEIASMWTKDPVLLAPLAVTGKPRVVELAVPLVITRHSHSAARAVIATYGRALGCIPSAHRFDLCVTAPLGSDAIIAVHTEGDASFHAMGRSYREGFVNSTSPLIGSFRRASGVIFGHSYIGPKRPSGRSLP